MGRRAKNKQGDPAAFVEAQENTGRPSQKKLGKRKADDVDSNSKRPAKKVKESDTRPGKPPKSTIAKGKEKTVVKSEVRANPNKPKSKKKQDRFEDEDEAAGSSEGWEDVEDDDDDLHTQAKCVYLA